MEVLHNLFINSAILTIIVKITWSIVSYIIYYFFERFSVSYVNFSICLKNWGKFAKHIQFYCLIVRYGTDDYIKNMANQREKLEGKLRNKILPIKTEISRNNLILKLQIPLHKRLGTQFKCFFETSLNIETIKKLASQTEAIYKIESSGSVQKNRYFFLLKHFPEIKTVEGIVNNMLYPI